MLSFLRNVIPHYGIILAVDARLKSEKLMRKVDIGIGVFFTLFGMGAMAQALRLAFFQRNGIPGPGFFPTILAILLVILGCSLIFSRVRGTPEQFGSLTVPDGTELRRVLGVWGAIGISVLMLEVIGFVGAMFLLIAVMLLAIERLYTWKAGLTILVVPLMFYILFAVLLDVRLPTGIWGT